MVQIELLQSVWGTISKTITICFYGALILRVVFYFLKVFYPSFRIISMKIVAKRIIREWRHSTQNIKEKDPVTKENALTMKQIDLIASRRWKDVLVWIVFHPDELLWVDKRNQNALHHACLFRAPAQIIEMMLFQAPEAAAMANIDGELPLHWAVRLSAPKEVLKWLLLVNPASGCNAKDKDGYTPLSLTWERHESKLVAKWWESGTEEILKTPAWKQIVFFLRSYAFHYFVRNGLIPSSVMEALSSEDYFADNNTSTFLPPLHSATECPFCPASLFALFLRVYHEQLLTKDLFGRIPLMLACSDPVSNRSCGILTKVHLLLSESPESVQVFDATGRLPIFCALESGLTWEEGIDRLLLSSPKTLLLSDPVTRLTPFLLAATGTLKRDKRFAETAVCSSFADGQSTDIITLSTIYSLLRADPSQMVLSQSSKSAISVADSKITIELQNYNNRLSL